MTKDIFVSICVIRVCEEILPSAQNDSKSVMDICGIREIRVNPYNTKDSNLGNKASTIRCVSKVFF